MTVFLLTDSVYCDIVGYGFFSQDDSAFFFCAKTCANAHKNTKMQITFLVYVQNMHIIFGGDRKILQIKQRGKGERERRTGQSNYANP